MKARINGVASQMKGFDFFYGVSLGQLILRHSDNLSRTLQRVDISLAEGLEVTRLTVTTLRSLRSESMYKLFLEKVTKIAASLGVTEPKLPRRRKVPRRMEVGSVDTHSFPSTMEDYYRQMYFVSLDLITTCICNRFYQPGYKMYCNIQELLLKAARNEQYQAELDLVNDFYGSDLNQYLLNTQLQVLSTMFASQVDKSVNIVNIVQLFNYMSTAKRELISGVGVLLKLLLVMPSSNSVS